MALMKKYRHDNVINIINKITCSSVQKEKVYVMCQAIFIVSLMLFLI